jgi:hypothetical protein
VTAKAKEFVARLLLDDSGFLEKRVFEEYVRDFVGLDNEVNAGMSRTPEDSAKARRFGILNNGFTIVSSNAMVQGNDIYMGDFQIVKGCQTPNVLFENRAQIFDDITVTLKIAETTGS